jgi:hypothetical protein
MGAGAGATAPGFFFLKNPNIFFLSSGYDDGLGAFDLAKSGRSDF